MGTIKNLVTLLLLCGFVAKGWSSGEGEEEMEVGEMEMEEEIMSEEEMEEVLDVEEEEENWEDMESEEESEDEDAEEAFNDVEDETMLCADYVPETREKRLPDAVIIGTRKVN